MTLVEERRLRSISFDTRRQRARHRRSRDDPRRPASSRSRLRTFDVISARAFAPLDRAARLGRALFHDRDTSGCFPRAETPSRNWKRSELHGRVTSVSSRASPTRDARIIVARGRSAQSRGDRHDDPDRGRQPERRGRQDDDRDQPRHRARRDRLARAADRPRSAGQRLDRPRHRPGRSATARATSC